MNIKTIISISLIGLLINISSFAQDKAPQKSQADHLAHKGHDHSDQEAALKKVGQDKLVVKVKGMVCAFCAQGIEKNFGKQKQVKKTKVDLDKMEVTIHLKKGETLEEEVIKKIVTDAGFAYAGMTK